MKYKIIDKLNNVQIFKILQRVIEKNYPMVENETKETEEEVKLLIDIRDKYFRNKE